MTTPQSSAHSETAALPAWARASLTFDMDAHAAAQGSWLLRYEQLSRGQFRGELKTVQFDGLRLFSERTNVALRQRGRLDEQAYGFAMSLHSTAEVFFNGRRVPDDAIMCGRGDHIDLLTPAPYSLIALAVDRDLLNPLWERMYQKPLASWLERQMVLQPTPEWSAALRQKHVLALQRAMALAEHGSDISVLGALRDDILIEWIEALPPSVDASDLDTLERRKRMVDKACELMLATPDEPLSILQVCSRVGASRRKLNYCFQDVLGTSPTKYLRALRLNGARRDLKAGSRSSVQDVAARWGFWHLGEFSRDYKTHFFELPSETLTRAKKSQRFG
jgi:AraC family ethanolamine operon transcriptional activator